MSGLTERVIENWLTNADERGYQASLVSDLIRRGHEILYVSPHSSLEHGKDIVAFSPEGSLDAYQLKVGNISVAAWHAIEGEISDAFTIPFVSPRSGRAVSVDNVFLVTTGRLSDPVRHALDLISRRNVDMGRAPVRTIEFDSLLTRFAESFDSFAPVGIGPLRDLIEIAAQRGTGFQNRELVWKLFQRIRPTKRQKTSARRSVANLLAAAEFSAAPFRAKGNHIPVIETWTIALAQLELAAGLHRLPRSWVAEGRLVCMRAIDESAEDLWTEAEQEDEFAGGDFFDQVVAGNQALIVLGFLAAALNAWRIKDGIEARNRATRLRELLFRNPPTIWGEGSWNYIFNLAMALRSFGEGVNVGFGLITEWVDALSTPSGRPGVAHPYFTVSEANERKLSPPDLREQDFESPVSYTIEAAVDFMARRWDRGTLAKRWKSVSRTQAASYLPRARLGDLEWHTDEGTLEIRRFPIEGSWSALNRHALSRPPTVLAEGGSAWLLPYFMCVYPHRVHPDYAAELDFSTSPPEQQQKWDRQI